MNMTTEEALAEWEDIKKRQAERRAKLEEAQRIAAENKEVTVAVAAENKEVTVAASEVPASDPKQGAGGSSEFRTIFTAHNDGWFDYFVCAHCGAKVLKVPDYCPSCHRKVAKDHDGKETQENTNA